MGEISAETAPNCSADMALIPVASALVWPPPPQPIRNAIDVAMTVNCAIFFMRSLVGIDGSDGA